MPSSGEHRLMSLCGRASLGRMGPYVCWLQLNPSYWTSSPLSQGAPLSVLQSDPSLSEKRQWHQSLDSVTCFLILLNTETTLCPRALETRLARRRVFQRCICGPAFVYQTGMGNKEQNSSPENSCWEKERLEFGARGGICLLESPRFRQPLRVPWKKD